MYKLYGNKGGSVVERQSWDSWELPDKTSAIAAMAAFCSDYEVMRVNAPNGITIALYTFDGTYAGINT